VLKITIDDFPDKQIWSLQGRLVGQWADELSSTWRERHCRPDGHKCIVELLEVTYIDRRGEAVLVEIMNQGADFVASDVYTKYLLEMLRRQLERTRVRRKMIETRYRPGSIDGSKETADVANNDFEGRLRNPRTVLHWYDFLCPFCYVGQSRTTILVRHGLDVIELPLQAHPDIPPAGVPVGPRNGLMYANLEREAKDAGLRLNWPPRLPDTRRALAAAEWVRRHQPDSFHQFQKALFAAHFAHGEDLGNPAVVDQHATDLGIDLRALHTALADGSAFAAVKDAEKIGHRYGVQGTPAWLIAQQLISGLLPAAEFDRLAKVAMQLGR
jgi:predicted DsbA family dithiol-disulfide isomerase